MFLQSLCNAHSRCSPGGTVCGAPTTIVCGSPPGWPGDRLMFNLWPCPVSPVGKRPGFGLPGRGSLCPAAIRPHSTISRLP